MKILKEYKNENEKITEEYIFTNFDFTFVLTGYRKTIKRGRYKLEITEDYDFYFNRNKNKSTKVPHEIQSMLIDDVMNSIKIKTADEYFKNK